MQLLLRVGGWDDEGVTWLRRRGDVRGSESLSQSEGGAWKRLLQNGRLLTVDSYFFRCSCSRAKFLPFSTWVIWRRMSRCCLKLSTVCLPVISVLQIEWAALRVFGSPLVWTERERGRMNAFVDVRTCASEAERRFEFLWWEKKEFGVPLCAGSNLRYQPRSASGQRLCQSFLCFRFLFYLIIWVFVPLSIRLPSGVPWPTALRYSFLFLASGMIVLVLVISWVYLLA